MRDSGPPSDSDVSSAPWILATRNLGKVRELSWDPTLAYTDEGQLLGHINIAVEMLNEKLKAAESRLGQSFNAETVLRLKHMILSHHGTLGFGSPVISASSSRKHSARVRSGNVCRDSSSSFSRASCGAALA